MVWEQESTAAGLLSAILLDTTLHPTHPTTMRGVVNGLANTFNLHESL